ncbi:hypothetical protein FQA39_LY02807 [Lamprigera yunnana]|nr:hypothetical protein FQA39_LY02807 [Lamprigera yunnana]
MKLYKSFNRLISTEILLLLIFLLRKQNGMKYQLSLNLTKTANLFSSILNDTEYKFRERTIDNGRSSRPSYRDDAISYVQLKREGKICTVKCKICPEHKVHAKLYGVTLTVDEDEEKVTSVQCHDCVAAQGGCKRAIVLLMWIHRRSEEPSCTEVQRYWLISKLSRVGTTLKFITAKNLSNGSCILPYNPSVLETFLEEGKKRKLSNCELLRSSRPSYRDDAISYVQLKREGKICTVKCKICPEHKVHAKLYGVTLTVDEDEEKVTSVQCHDCVAAQGGCKRAIVLLMWIHRRSEEPSCTEVQRYWLISKLSRVGTTLKFITAKNLSNGSCILPYNPSVLETFLEEGKKRKLSNCELLRYQRGYICNDFLSASMHQLVLKYREKSCDIFLDKINNLTDEIINQIENETRDQYKNSLWYELRYGRITASGAYEVSRCQKDDGILISLIMGGKIPDTPAMKRGRSLEDEVRKTVGIKLGKKN